VNIVLDAVMKRAREQKWLHLNAFFWLQCGPKET